MSDLEEARTPIEVIERIRNEEYLLDIEGESDKVKRGAKSLHKKLNNALRLLSEELYSKQAHFVLELIQNADDNEYAVGVVPKLTLDLTPERLILVNNEKGFIERNVQALCSVGESSKPDKSGYIGEKGIGFKSVFLVSNAPEIHSNGYHFRFDRTEGTNLLGFVVPHWCEPILEVNKTGTTIILPAKDNYLFGSETLKDIDASLLLFLSRIRQLTLVGTDVRVTYLRKDIERISYLTTKRESTETPSQIQEMRFIRVETPFSMQKVSDEKRPDVKTSSVVLAMPVDSTGAADPHQKRTKAGRLMSYAASPGEAHKKGDTEDLEKTAARDATDKAAVDYFLATQAGRWKSLTPMPHNNPGFDIKAEAHDGTEEFIEVKGRSAAWTEDGVALTPTELVAAQRWGERFWLCVVEYAQDEKRRRLYLLKDPYGLTQQFRFDSGWKSAALSEAAVPLKPEAGLFIDIPGKGKGRILSAPKKGRFYKLHVVLEGGRQVNKTFNPATMKLSTE